MSEELYQNLRDLDLSGKAAFKWARGKDELKDLPKSLQLPHDLESALQNKTALSGAEARLVRLVFAQAGYFRKAAEAYRLRSGADPIDFDSAERLCELYARRSELEERLYRKALSTSWPPSKPSGIERDYAAVAATASKIEKLWHPAPKAPKIEEVDVQYSWADSEHKSADLRRGLGVKDLWFKELLARTLARLKSESPVGQRSVYTWRVALTCLQRRLWSMSAARRISTATELLEQNPANPMSRSTTALRNILKNAKVSAL